MFASLYPPYNAGFLRLSKPERLQPLPPDEDKVDPPPQERMEDPSTMGLAATTDDDNHTPSPKKEVTFAASSDKAETFGETAGETPPSPSNSMKEASPETSASQDSSGAKLHPPPEPHKAKIMCRTGRRYNPHAGGFFAHGKWKACQKPYKWSVSQVVSSAISGRSSL